MDEFKVEHFPKRRACRIGIPSQLNVGNRLDLMALVSLELDSGTVSFEVDLAETAYIDSTGLAILVALKKKVEKSGGNLVLSHLSPDHRKLLELIHLDELLQITA